MGRSPYRPEPELDRLLLRDSLPRVLAQSDQALHERFAELQNTHFTLISKLADEYRAEGAKLTGVATGQAQAAGAALAASSGRLGDVQDAAAVRDAKLQDYRSALLTVGLAITREQPKLAGTDAERKAAIDAITATCGC